MQVSSEKWEKIVTKKRVNGKSDRKALEPTQYSVWGGRYHWCISAEIPLTKPRWQMGASFTEDLPEINIEVVTMPFKLCLILNKTWSILRKLAESILPQLSCRPFHLLEDVTEERAVFLLFVLLRALLHWDLVHHLGGHSLALRDLHADLQQNTTEGGFSISLNRNEAFFGNWFVVRSVDLWITEPIKGTIVIISYLCLWLCITPMNAERIIIPEGENWGRPPSAKPEGSRGTPDVCSWRVIILPRARGEYGVITFCHSSRSW